jgi:glycosyltransferase involved in cell wall biosynthesis
MIVKDEAPIIQRCLASVAEHISSWVICDTGSTDGTQDLVRQFFGALGIPGELHRVEFENFSQARNAALDIASRSKADYLLLCDADMELVVDRADVFDGLSAPAYTMPQRAGGLSYRNVRLQRTGASGRYRGVTHEYLDTEAVDLDGAWFRDHADGRNRPGKIGRDIALLTAAVDRDPTDARSVFYLAQSYRDAGAWTEASELYERRATMGGWDEEAWRAKLEQARCLRRMGYAAAFVECALQAFDMRRHRSEPLYDLSQHYRAIGMNRMAGMFAEQGMRISYPHGDRLFIEDYVYSFGFAEEYSIVGYHMDPSRRAIGAAACRALAESELAPMPTRNLAKRNLIYYQIATPSHEGDPNCLGTPARSADTITA